MEVSDNNFKMELQGKKSDVLAAFLYAMDEEPGLYQLMSTAVTIHSSEEYQKQVSEKQTQGDA